MKWEEGFLMLVVAAVAFALVFACGAMAYGAWHVVSDPCAPSIQGQDSTITRS